MTKQKFVTTGIGLFLIFFGVSLLLEVLFGISIPVGRIFFGFLLCCIGYYCISYRHTSHRNWYSCHRYYTDTNTTTLDTLIVEINENMVSEKEPFEYTTTLGSSVIDLTRFYVNEPQQKNSHTIFINTRLGHTILKINKNYAFCINTHGTLSHVTLPHGQNHKTNTHIFCNHTDNLVPDIQIYAHTVLGHLDIVLV